jgi:PhnB protein
MAQLNVYLTFNGNCREAMEFYHSCFGGDLEISLFGEMPDGSSAADKDRVMHANIRNGEFTLMASDNGSGYPEVITGTSISLSLNCTSEEEIDELFGKVAAGGKVTMPLENTFWGAKFGMFTDKFGMPWMMNYDHPKD